jgi:hypothetical protein
LQIASAIRGQADLAQRAPAAGFIQDQAEAPTLAPAVELIRDRVVVLTLALVAGLTQVLVAARQLDQAVARIQVQVVGHIPALAVEHIRGQGEAATADLEQEAQISGIVRLLIANSLSEQACGLTLDLKRKKSF